MSFANHLGSLVYQSNNKILHWIRSNNYRMVYYHMVSDKFPDYYFKNKIISAENFREQIRFFKKHYKFLTVGEAIERKANGQSLKGYMTITSDDGFVENYTIIAPILREENLRATFFLIDKCIDNQHLMWRNKLIYISNTVEESRLNEIIVQFSKDNNLGLPNKGDDILTWSRKEFDMRKKEQLTDQLWTLTNMPRIDQFLEQLQPYMTSDQIKELVDQGFELGAHGITHPYLGKSDYEQLEEEVIGSINGIEKKFGVSVKAFSYPFGSRANSRDEQLLLERHGDKIRALIGIKNKLYNDDPHKWERDLQETKPGMAAFRFFILPYIRRIIN